MGLVKMVLLVFCGCREECLVQCRWYVMVLAEGTIAKVSPILVHVNAFRTGGEVSHIHFIPPITTTPDKMLSVFSTETRHNRGDLGGSGVHLIHRRNVDNDASWFSRQLERTDG